MIRGRREGWWAARTLLALSFLLAFAPAVPGADFQVTKVPDVTDVEAPKPFDRAALKQAQGVGMSDLQKYSVAAGLDKSDAIPREKAEGWRKLAKEAPGFAAIAGKRAAEWDAYATKVEEEFRKRKAAAMESDWKRLLPLLVDNGVPGEDKAKGAWRFLLAYKDSPGVDYSAVMDMHSLVPPGKMKDALKDLDREGRVGMAYAISFAVERRIRAGGGAGIGIDSLRKLYESRDKAWQESGKGKAVGQAVKTMNDARWEFRIVEDDKGKTMAMAWPKTGDPPYVSRKRFTDFTSLDAALNGELADDIVNWVMHDPKSPMSAPYKAALDAIRGDEVSRP